MREHKIITCTGYGATGSSVITDLLKEFKTVHSLGDFEFSISLKAPMRFNISSKST